VNGLDRYRLDTGGKRSKDLGTLKLRYGMTSHKLESYTLLNKGLGSSESRAIQDLSKEAGSW
jgi:hypothetical protein